VGDEGEGLAIEVGGGGMVALGGMHQGRVFQAIDDVRKLLEQPLTGALSLLEATCFDQGWDRVGQAVQAIVLEDQGRAPGVG
jgi:hypothetical protein